MNDSEILWYNWTRMEMLSKISDKTETEKIEMTMRSQMQNAFSLAGSESKENIVIKGIEETLLPEIIKKVDNFKRKK